MSRDLATGVAFRLCVNITLSALQLEITPDAWQKPVAAAVNPMARPVAALKTDPLVCLTAGTVMLTYWLARDGWDAIIKGSIMIGIKTAWQQVKEEIRVKAHAEGRALGHTEGRAEEQSKAHAAGHAEGRAEAYAELKGKTLSEIAAELGLDEPAGTNGHNPPSSDSAAGRPENAC